MTPSISRVILELVVEDSYSLPELVYRATDADRPPRAEHSRAAIESCMRSMLDAGLVAVVRVDVPGGEEVVLDRTETDSALQDDLEWSDGPWRPHIRVVATSEGRAVYRTGS